MRKSEDPGLVEADVTHRAYDEKVLVSLFGSHIATAKMMAWGEMNTLPTKQLKEAEKVGGSN